MRGFVLITAVSRRSTRRGDAKRVAELVHLADAECFAFAGQFRDDNPLNLGSRCLGISSHASGSNQRPPFAFGSMSAGTGYSRVIALLDDWSRRCERAGGDVGPPEKAMDEKPQSNRPLFPSRRSAA